MNIRLDRLVTVEYPVLATDGTQVPTWTPLVYAVGSPAVAEKFPAEVQDVMPSRAESVIQGLVVARNQVRIRLRWRNDIDSSMRVTLHGETDQVMQIVAGPAEVFGRKKAIEIVCEKISS